MKFKNGKSVRKQLTKFLTQANEAGSSTAMEALGHKKALTYLLTTGIVITTFVSDRHATITKWMRETCPKICKDLGKPIIKHFFDLWHIGKSMFASKVLKQNYK